MKTIIAGSREGVVYADVEKAMKLCGWIPSEIVSGGARGVDTLGEHWAAYNKCPVKRFLPDWNKFGKSAGFRRNAEMGNYADALVAIWDGKSRGTLNMIEYASSKNLIVFVHRIYEK